MDIMNELNKYTDTLQVIGTILASFTSILAILIALLTYYSQKIHNRNSVKPLLNVIFGDYENCIYVKIQNNGVGPAIIKSMVCNNDKSETSDTLIGLIPKEKMVKIKNQQKIINLRHYNDFVKNIEERVIAPGNEIMLLNYTPDENII